MGKHIYLTVGVKSREGIYLDSRGNPSSVVNYRGEAQKGDADPERCKRFMARFGRATLVTDTLLKPNTQVDLDGQKFVINYPECFAELVAEKFGKK